MLRKAFKFTSKNKVFLMLQLSKLRGWFEQVSARERPGHFVTHFEYKNMVLLLMLTLKYIRTVRYIHVYLQIVVIVIVVKIFHKR